MVSAQPAPTDPGAARNTEPEATRPRRLLRGDGELLLVEPYESDRGANLAEVAFSAQLERLLRLGEPVGTAGAVSAAGSPGRPLSVPARVNRWPDEPDAVIPHVRICGSPGWVTAQGDPARSCFPNVHVQVLTALPVGNWLVAISRRPVPPRSPPRSRKAAPEKNVCCLSEQ